MTARIVLVRHGNTFAPGESPRRIGARTDLPLVASGVAQAEALGRWFAARDIRFTRALTGPLQRAQQTCDLILGHSPPPPSIKAAEWLNEVDHGPDENRDETAVLARIGEEALARWDQCGTPPPGWIANAAARLDAWRGFVATLPPGDTLLVTSNGAARFALLAFPALAAGIPGSLKLRTGAYAELKRDDQGSLTLVSWDVRPDPDTR